MKKLLPGIIIGFALFFVLAAVSNVRFGLYGAFLQSDLNGNQMNETNVNTVTLGQLFIVTNALSAWPTAPIFPGQAVFVNSNGVVYLLTSGPGVATWAATNKLAP